MRSARWLGLPLVLLLWLQPASGEARTYRIATTPWMGWAFLDVADAKRFWKDQGLDVELQNYPDGTSYLDALLARKVDFANAMIGDAVWIHTHLAPVRILLETDWSAGGDKLFVRKGLRLSDLAGKPLGMYQARYSLPYFLALTLRRDWRYVEASRKVVLTPPDLVAQFQAHRLDMGVLCDPFLELLGPDAVTVATSADRAGSLPEGFIGFRDVVEAIPRDELRKLVRGILRAMAWMRDPRNAAELLAIVQARSFRDTPLRSVEDMVQQMRNAPVHSPALLRRRNAAGGGLARYLAGLRGFLQQYDPKFAGYPPAQLFDPRAAARWMEDGP